MKPTIIAKGVKLSQTLREYVVRRLRFALNRTQQNIQCITVRINDQNGPKGGVDKRCQIHLTLPGLPTIVVTEKAADIAAAVDQAAHRAAMAVNRLRARTKAIAHAKYMVTPPEPAMN
jgi:putative sigma-54 modulation protein